MRYSKVIGKKEEKNYLVSAIEQGRLAHAQLFTGNTGSGQLALAWATACYIMCTDKVDGDSCGKCASCIKTYNLAHPDLHFAFPVVKKGDLKRSDTTSNDYMDLWRASLLENPYMDIQTWTRKMGTGNSQPDINKEECSNILKKLTLKPFESTYKVVILWMPEYLKKEGNRLLKIIEEPTVNTFFILVSDGTEGILNTILSRTQLLKVSPFSADEISDYVGGIYDLPTDQLAPIAMLSDGNMSKAIAISSGLDVDYSDLYIEWIRACYKLEPIRLQEVVTQIAALGKEEQKHFLQYGVYFTRQIMMAHFGRYEEYTDRERLDKLKQSISADACEGIISVLDGCIGGVSRNLNSKIMLTADSITVGRLMRSKSITRSILA